MRNIQSLAELAKRIKRINALKMTSGGNSSHIDQFFQSLIFWQSYMVRF